MNMAEARMRLREAKTPEEQLEIVRELKAKREGRNGNAAATSREHGA